MTLFLLYSDYAKNIIISFYSVSYFKLQFDPEMLNSMATNVYMIQFFVYELLMYTIYPTMSTYNKHFAVKHDFLEIHLILSQSSYHIINSYCALLQN